MVNIKRKITFYLVFIILSIFALSSMVVNGEVLKVFDDATLFSEEEITELDDRASILSNTYEMDIIIVTTNDAKGKTSREYADDYFDDNGFGVGENLDGILFLIDMDNREAYISASGKGSQYITDVRREKVLDIVFDSGLPEGDYYNATKGFLKGTKEYLESGIPSDQYSEDENVKEKNSLTFMEAVISLLSGMILSGIFFFRTKARYKMKNPVKPLTFRDNSIVSLASEDDILMDKVITQRIIPKPSKNDSSSGKTTTHTSASGKTHSGGGRKF